MTSPAFDPSSVYGTLPENTIRILMLQPGRFKRQTAYKVEAFEVRYA